MISLNQKMVSTQQRTIYQNKFSTNNNKQLMPKYCFERFKQKHIIMYTLNHCKIKVALIPLKAIDEDLGSGNTL